MIKFNETYLRIKRLLEEIHSSRIKQLARKKEDSSSWTRIRKMPLYAMLLCTLAKKGLSTVMELRHYFIEAARIEQIVSKQDYLKQRQKLNPEVFKHLNQSYLSQFYSGEEAVCWNGYIVLGIDMSKGEIPNSAENRKVYGESENGHGKGVARVSISILYDVFNGFMLDVDLDIYNGNEIDQAKALVFAIKGIIGDRPVIILFDRGYVSLEFQDFLERSGVKYLMRLKSDAYKAEVQGMQSGDEEVSLLHNKNRMAKWRKKSPERWQEMSQKSSTDVRMVRIAFKDEEQGMLITNLRESSTKEIQDLYRKRWKVEEQYHTMKNKMKFESVTGNASIYVKQDFWAQMLVFNIIRDLIIKAEHEAKNKAREKSLRYEVRINENIAIGLFKEQFIKLMLEEDEDRKSAMFLSLIAEMERNILPIRKLKSSPRKRNKANKYKCNLKPSF